MDISKQKTIYDSLQYLIMGGKIQNFEEIFDYIKISAMSRDLKIGKDRFRSIRKPPEVIRLGELVKMADLLKIDVYKMAVLLRLMSEKP